ncbi:MAG: hypothetical protein KKD18_01255 [Nanoarchaeota archaeon]|nr:hypothetical protein [Nanoarchaeota archaeon]
MANYDIIGNVAIVKFARGAKVREKKRIAEALLKEKKAVTTVLEKTEKFSGRLRTQATKYLAGEKTKEVLYRENGCLFRLNVDTCYFSPRLAAERLEVAKMVKKNEDVLVMFGGVAPFAIVIARHSKAARVVSVELGRDCSKYALENVKRNKLRNVEIVQGDVRRKVPGLGKFDRVVMARPQLKDSFLDIGFKAVRKGGMIHYYGFYPVEEKDKMISMILAEASRARRQVRILRVKKAGEIGTKKYRWRVEMKVD